MSNEDRQEVMRILDEERDRLFEELDDHEPASAEYEAVMARLLDLQKVEESLTGQFVEVEKIHLDHDKLMLEAAPRPVDKNVLIGAAASIGGILLVIGYELFGEGILTSKAFALIPKPKF